MAEVEECRAAIAKAQAQVTRQATSFKALLGKEYTMPGVASAKDAFDNACEQMSLELDRYTTVCPAPVDKEANRIQTEYYSKRTAYLAEMKAKVHRWYQQCLELANRTSATAALVPDTAETESLLSAVTSAEGRIEAERDRLEELADMGMFDTRAKADRAEQRRIRAAARALRKEQRRKVVAQKRDALRRAVQVQAQLATIDAEAAAELRDIDIQDRLDELAEQHEVLSQRSRPATPAGSRPPTPLLELPVDSRQIEPRPDQQLPAISTEQGTSGLATTAQHTVNPSVHVSLGSQPLVTSSSALAAGNPVVVTMPSCSIPTRVSVGHHVALSQFSVTPSSALAGGSPAAYTSPSCNTQTRVATCHPPRNVTYPALIVSEPRDRLAPPVPTAVQSMRPASSTLTKQTTQVEHLQQVLDLEKQIYEIRLRGATLRESSRLGTEPSNLQMPPHEMSPGPVTTSSNADAISTSSQKDDLVAALLRRNFGSMGDPEDKFNGDSEQYPSFIYRFQQNTLKVISDPGCQLEALMAACTGKAKKAIAWACLAKSPKEGLEAALETLKRDFGTTHKIADAQLKHLHEGPKIADTEEGMQSLLCDMRNCRQVMAHLGRTTALDQPANLRPIFERLPHHMQLRFEKAAGQTSEHIPTFDLLLKHVEEKHTSYSAQVGQWRAELKRRKNSIQPRVRVNAVEPHEQEQDEIPEVEASVNLGEQDHRATLRCPLCNEREHRNLNACKVYMQSSPEERKQAVLRQRRCFRCLEKGHHARSCRSTVQCNKTECTKRWHHCTLHDAGTLHPTPSPTVASRESVDN